MCERKTEVQTRSNNVGGEEGLQAWSGGGGDLTSPLCVNKEMLLRRPALMLRFFFFFSANYLIYNNHPNGLPGRYRNIARLLQEREKEKKSLLWCFKRRMTQQKSPIPEDWPTPSKLTHVSLLFPQLTE